MSKKTASDLSKSNEHIVFEGGARRPTVPWRPFRAFPHGHQVGPIEHSQMDPTEGSRSTQRTTGCALAHISKLTAFLRCGKSQIGKLGQWSKCTLYKAVTLRHFVPSPSPFANEMAKTTKIRNGSRKHKETGTRKPRKSPGKNQTRRKTRQERG